VKNNKDLIQSQTDKIKSVEAEITQLESQKKMMLEKLEASRGIFEK
jgi:hypothetical protein